MIPQVFGRTECFGMATGSSKLEAFAVLNFAAPITEPSMSLATTALAMAYRALFAEYSFNGFITPLNMSNPLAPVVGTPVSLGVSATPDIAIGPDDEYALVLGTGMVLIPVSLTSPDPLHPSPGTPVSLGTGTPRRVVILPNGTFAFVLYGVSSTQHLVPADLSNPAAPVIGTPVIVGTSFGLMDMAVAPDSQSALIADTGLPPTQGIYTVDLTNPNVPVPSFVSLSGSGSTPNQVAYHPSGKAALVSNVSTNTVSALDTTHPLAPTVASTVAVGSGPQGVAISPDGTTGAVVNVNDSTISFLNLTNPLAPVVTATVALGFQGTEVVLYLR
ncbi:MAG TPA: hypothetical protein DCX12_12355 [Chloroflexi bacterium]|jgi:DNA-binding beta-propeller fold protein YncE|nr:hypothetical protein [Chloroflexota bacterium]